MSVEYWNSGNKWLSNAWYAVRTCDENVKIGERQASPAKWSGSGTPSGGAPC